MRARKLRTPRYVNIRKRAEFTPQERAFVLNLLREAREGADPRYVVDASGFWLSRHASPGYEARMGDLVYPST